MTEKEIDNPSVFSGEVLSFIGCECRGIVGPISVVIVTHHDEPCTADHEYIKTKTRDGNVIWERHD